MMTHPSIFISFDVAEDFHTQCYWHAFVVNQLSFSSPIHTLSHVFSKNIYFWVKNYGGNTRNCLRKWSFCCWQNTSSSIMWNYWGKQSVLIKNQSILLFQSKLSKCRIEISIFPPALRKNPFPSDFTFRPARNKGELIGYGYYR